jgi:hypothetical protein
LSERGAIANSGSVQNLYNVGNSRWIRRLKKYLSLE